MTAEGVTGDDVAVAVVLSSSHSITGSFFGSVVPLHQHLQSFPTKPSPGQLLLGQ